MSGRVLVVGAGIGGLATARALARQGIACRVIERRPDRPEVGLALNLPGNAVAALQRLGAAQPVLDAGVLVTRREYRTSKNRLLFAIDEAWFWSGVAPSVCASRGVVLDALGEGIAVERGLGAMSVDRERNGRVRVTLSDGTEALADLVVAADGVRSTLRSVLTSARPRSSRMTHASWGSSPSDPGISCWTAWTGHGRAFLLIPIASGLVYTYASSSRGGGSGADASWLVDAYARFPEPVTRVIRQALSAGCRLYRSPVDEVRIRTWQDGAVILLGDAAHATGPVWAEGAGAWLWRTRSCWPSC